MRKINWGIIGLGNIAHSFSKGFFEVKNAKLLAASSLTKEKCENFQKKFNIKENYIFDEYDKIFSCKDIDIIYVTLPNNFHYEWIKKCLENNKNLLIEKPALIDSQNIVDFEKKIKDRKSFFSEGFMYRFHPQIKSILDVIKNGEIGQPISMETSFGVNLLTKKKLFFFKKKKKIDPHGRLFNKNLGGGCILDLGCYPSSFSLLISSLVENINIKNFKIKNLYREIGETGVDIDAEAEINFDNKFVSKIKASFKRDLGSRSVIYGTLGSILIENTWHGGKVDIKIKNEKQTIFKKIKRNIFSYQIENISNDLLDDKKEIRYPGMSVDETIQNTKILDSWINEQN